MLQFSLHSYTLPLRAELVLPRARLTQREGLLLQVQSSAGHEGWGEAAPLPGFSRESLAEAEADLCTAVEAIAASAAVGRSFSMQEIPLCPSARCALHLAFAHLAAAEAQAPLHRHLNPAAPDTVRLACLLPTAPEETLPEAERAQHEGYTRLKVKVGRRGLREEIKLVQRLAQRLKPGSQLRLDANRAWDLDRAITFFAEIQGLPVEFIEEPLHDPHQLPQLLERVELPIALDETISEWSQAALAAKRTPVQSSLLALASAVVWKPTLSGLSIQEVQRFLCTAPRPLPVIVSAAFESGLALMGFAAYAAALGEAHAGLDTYRWLAAEVMSSPLPLPAPSLRLSQLAEHHIPERARLRLHWRK